MAYQNKPLAPSAQQGYSLIELLMAMAIFGFLVSTLFTGFIATREGKPQQEQRRQAAAVYQETIEALRVIREQGWDQIAQNGTFHPQTTATSWTLAPGSEVINPDSGMTRSIMIADVFRDALGNITLLGGTLDPSTKAITITVSWNQPLVSTYSNTIYMTRYLDNLAFIDTTVADFSRAGHVATSVVFTENDGGEITLDAAGPGRGNWCEPGSAAVSQLDLPRQGAARAITAIQGKIFSTTGENASGVSLAYVTVTDAYPPVTTLAGTFDGYKTNDVFGTDQHGFLATDTNAREVAIVNLNNMTLAGYYDIPGPNSALSIYVLDGVGYVIAGSTLYRFSADPIVGSASQAGMGSIGLGANGSSVYVVDGVAYVSLAATSNQLRLVDVSNPSSMTMLGSLTVNGGQARDVYISPEGHRAYLVTAGDASRNEFFIINTENKNSLSVIASYDTNGMDPKAVDLVLSGNRAVIVGVGGEEYQVVTISPETNPTRCGGFNEDSGIWDIATVVEDDTDAYAYINTGQANSELKVIEGGPGGSYSMTGQYESAAFDTGSNTAYNRLSFTGNVPDGTTLRLQVAGAPLGPSSCEDASYSFVGPGGAIDEYFTGELSAIPFDNQAGGHNNPARCFKYKAFFDTTDILLTPMLEDITINYSP